MYGTIRRIWWTVGIVSAILLFLAVALVWRARVEAASPPPEASAARATAAPAPAASAAKPTGTARAPSAVHPDAPVVVAAPPRAGAKVAEVCGLDAQRLSSAASDEDYDQRLDDAVANATVPWDDMQASGDERIRAAGFALADRIEPLAKLAAQTRDASVYAIAQNACAKLAQEPGTAATTDKAWCETLDAGKRAALEPDNAVAWLQAASEADAKHDAAATDEALRRAAAAPALRHHTTAAVMQVERHASTARPASTSLWVHRALEDAGVHSAVLPTSLCERAAPARREACLQITQRLLDQPNAIGDLAMGIALGRQLGLDDSMLARKRDELEAVQMAENVRLERWTGPDRYTCAVLGGKRDWLRKAQAQGEWRSARDAAVAQAGSMDALVQQLRESTTKGSTGEGQRR